MATAILIKPTTPQDYHRIVSTKLSVPTDANVSVPVGLLACQRDPMLRSLETFIVSATISSVTKDKRKAGKKAVIAPTIPEGPILQAILHDTVIFPEGGGQPTDTGNIVTKGDDRVWKVIQAKRHGGHAVHYIQLPSDDISTVSATFAPGTPVTVVLGDEDYQRRYDHMSMHTSQHLLSALMETRLNLPTLSWSLTTYPSPCYVEVPRGMTAEEILSVQNEANRLVFEGRKVHIEVDVLEESEPQEIDTPAPGAPRAVGKGLPQDYTGGVKRVVVIDGVDRNPCCGTHLPSIHNLQIFLFPHTEALSRSSTTSARLYFLAGPRLIDHLVKSHSLVTESAALLSCGAPLLPERLGQVIDDRKKSDKRVGDLEVELADRIGKDLVQRLVTNSTSNPESVGTYHLHRTDDTSNPLGFLSSITTSIISDVAEENLGIKPYLFILSSTPSSQTVTSLTTVVVTGSSNELIKHAGESLKSRLGIKGGGKGTRWGGKFIGVWKDSKEGSVIREILETFEK